VKRLQHPLLHSRPIHQIEFKVFEKNALGQNQSGADVPGDDQQENVVVSSAKVRVFEHHAYPTVISPHEVYDPLLYIWGSAKNRP
jgi:hypothetical protein